MFNTSKLSWSAQAQQALNQAITQMPIPGLVKGQVKKQLARAAEKQAVSAGHNEVTPEDLMAAMLSKLPDSMRGKVESALQDGPDGLKKLRDELEK